MKSQARLRLRRPVGPVATMLKVAGKSFRCRCGANVFTRIQGAPGLPVFRCNGCGECYG